MHSAFTRANIVFFFALSVLMACGLGCALSRYTDTAHAAANLRDIRIGGVSVSYPKPFRGAQRGFEYALIEFDVAADLTPMWNWNTKQILVSVVGNFATEAHRTQSQLLWGRIISQEQGAAASRIQTRVQWDMQQLVSEFHARGREVSLLSAPRGELHSIARNPGPASNCTIELRLQFEVFPQIGTTLLYQIEGHSTRFEIAPDQPFYLRRD